MDSPGIALGAAPWFNPCLGSPTGPFLSVSAFGPCRISQAPSPKTSRSVLAAVYKVGVAVAPVPDQQLYDTIYQERYMGLPKDNPSLQKQPGQPGEGGSRF